MSTAAATPEPAAQAAASPPLALPAMPPGLNYATHAGLLGISAVVLLLSFVLHSSNEETIYFLGLPLPPLCQFHYWTGLNCPGCGLTRAFVRLAHGDFAAAWHFNPAAFVVFPLVAAQVPYRSWQLWRMRRGLGAFADIRLLAFLWLAVGAVFLQWIARIVEWLLP